MSQMGGLFLNMIFPDSHLGFFLFIAPNSR